MSFQAPAITVATADSESDFIAETDSESELSPRKLPARRGAPLAGGGKASLADRWTAFQAAKPQLQTAGQRPAGSLLSGSRVLIALTFCLIM